MECSIYALIACFSWSGFYVDGGLTYQDASLPYHYWKDVSPPPRDGVIETAFVSAIGHEARNPYFRGALGFQLSFRKVQLSLEAFHDSSLSTSEDSGINGVTLRARWYPFRH